MLTSKSLSNFFLKSDRSVYIFFAISILLGFSVGFYFFENTGIFSVPMMRVALSCNVSITSLLCSVFLPLVFSFLAVYFSKQWLVYLVCFWKLFSFGFSTNCILHAYGAAGWLVQSLSMISDLVVLLLMIWFCVRNICTDRHSPVRDFLTAACVTILVFSVDYFYVSPFVTSLISN